MTLIRRAPSSQNRWLNLIDKGDDLEWVSFGVVTRIDVDYRYEILMTPDDARRLRDWINEVLGERIC